MAEPVLIMVAPNGARRTKKDHPALPVSIAETARCAAECFAAGAGAIHAHIRDEHGRHVLDPEGYKDLIAAIGREAGPDLAVQITTEAVGRYTPAQQRSLVKAVHPDAVSIAIREMLPDPEPYSEACDFYAWCRLEQIGVQHILYDLGDLERLLALRTSGALPDGPTAILMVLGRYADEYTSNPAELMAFAARLHEAGDADLIGMVCAFGKGERAALATALGLGLHVRVGFENSIVDPHGRPIASNSISVAQIAGIAEVLGRSRVEGHRALEILGRTGHPSAAQ